MHAATATVLSSLDHLIHPQRIGGRSHPCMDDFTSYFPCFFDFIIERVCVLSLLEPNSQKSKAGGGVGAHIIHGSS